MTNELEGLFRSMSLLAFYRDGDNYRADMGRLDTVTNDVFEIIRDAKNSIRYYDKVDEVKMFSDAYDKFFLEMNALRIPAQEFMHFMEKSEISPSIQNYFDIRNRLHDAAVPLFFYGTHIEYEPSDLTPSHNESVDPQNVILNHNNPFADITIKNQEFLYPDAEGKFQTLRFTVGYTMTKIEREDDTNILSLQPDFKISKGHDREPVHTNITMDDTITSPMPKTSGENELLYI